MTQTNDNAVSDPAGLDARALEIAREASAPMFAHAYFRNERNRCLDGLYDNDRVVKAAKAAALIALRTPTASAGEGLFRGKPITGENEFAYRKWLEQQGVSTASADVVEAAAERIHAISPSRQRPWAGLHEIEKEGYRIYARAALRSTQ